MLERERCGFGASGRNGGWLSGQLRGRARLGRRHGPTSRAASDNQTIDVVGEWCAAEGVDCDLVKGGSLSSRLTVPSLRRLQKELAGGAGTVDRALAA